MASWVTPNEVVPKPSNWKARQFRVHPVHDSDVKALKGSDTIDLGNMKLEVKVVGSLTFFSRVTI